MEGESKDETFSGATLPMFSYASPGIRFLAQQPIKLCVFCFLLWNSLPLPQRAQRLVSRASSAAGTTQHNTILDCGPRVVYVVGEPPEGPIV